MLTASIAQTITRILQTPLGSRVGNPAFGSRLHLLVDRIGGEGWQMDAVRYAREALSLEPRISIESLTAHAGADGKAVIALVWTEKASGAQTSTEVSV